jgi:hypothetical protein
MTTIENKIIDITDIITAKLDDDCMNVRGREFSSYTTSITSTTFCMILNVAGHATVHLVSYLNLHLFQRYECYKSDIIYKDLV